MLHQSVAALLDTLKLRKAIRKVFIFGDMLELGSDSARFHEEIAPQVRDAGIDVFVTIGARARLASGGAAETVGYTDAGTAAVAMPSLLKPGDLVAVKASRKMGLEKVVAAIRAMGESAPALSWRMEDELERQS